HFTIPYAAIEPIREALDSGMASDRMEKDERWMHALREEIRDAEMEFSVVLCRKRITLKDLVRIRPGDVIPLDIPDLATVLVEKVPCFQGQVGLSKNKYAVRITKRLSRDGNQD
ncbi:MAG: FliM/FliN family flagellar motor switch protein, partial [Haliea sp.]